VNATELMQYLAAQQNGGHWVGNPDTMRAAMVLAKAGMLNATMKRNDGAVYFVLTEKGRQYVHVPAGTKAKKVLTSAAHVVQDYATAFKEEHPVGIGEAVNTVKKAAAGMGGGQESGSEVLNIPGLAYGSSAGSALGELGMMGGVAQRQPVPQAKAPVHHRKKGKGKAKEYVIVNGVRYKRT
jgi:hypothetical protein